MLNRKKIVWLFETKTRISNENSPAMIWWSGVLENLGYDVMYYPYEEYVFEEFFQTIKKHAPEFIIHAAYTLVHSELEKLRDISKVFVLQCDDRWRYESFGKYWIPFIDGIITYDGELENYKRDGLKAENFHKMNWAFNPVTMYKEKNNIKDILISHIGGNHGNRIQKLNEFKQNGCDVSTHSNILYEEVKNIWSRSKFSLNFTINSTQQLREVKGRIVEIPAFDSVLLTEWFPEIDQYYDLDNEIIVFDTVLGAIDLIKKYNKDSILYNKVMLNGKKALFSRLTAYHEWNKILPNIDSDYKQVNPIKILKEKHGIII